MRWPWQEKAAVKTGGAEALARSTEKLKEEQGRWPEVSQVAASMRYLRERNHLSERMAELYRGK